jgi:hypothetical protein
MPVGNDPGSLANAPNARPRPSHHRIRLGKRRDRRAAQRFDDVESDWKRRSREPEALDHVGELPRQHVVVGGSCEDVPGFLSG